MYKILAFAGSNSPTSINHQLVLNVSKRISEHEVEVLKLSNVEFPMFSIVTEKKGTPGTVKWLYDHIQEVPALSLSDRLKDRGFLVSHMGKYSNCLKIRPPLVFSQENANEFLAAFDECMAGTGE